jgi:serine protease Do
MRKRCHSESRSFGIGSAKQRTVILNEVKNLKIRNNDRDSSPFGLRMTKGVGTQAGQARCLSYQWEKSRRGGLMHKFKFAFLLAIILGGSAVGGQTLGSLEEELKALFEEVKPSIVTVKYEASDFGKGLSEFLGKKLVTTGVIIDDDGHILTTKNFYSDPKNIEVELSNEEKLKAEFIGWDAKSKIAVIKIEKDALIPSKTGSSEGLEASDWALIIGNAFGIPHSVTLGTVSGKREKEDFIQVNANVSPGSSGAGVFNTDKELVGVVAATLSRNIYVSPNELKIGIELSKGVFSTSDGSALVIPVERAMSIAKDIIEKGSREPGWLGVYISDLSEELKGVGRIDEGAVVTKVIEDSPAEKAGIQKWDVIVKFDNKPVKDAESLTALVSKTKPGTKAKIMLLREGKKKELSTEIKKRKDSPYHLYYYHDIPKFLEGDIIEPAGEYGWLGIYIDDVSEELKGVTKIDEGAVVKEVVDDSPAAKAGIQKWDIIVKFDNKPVKDADSLVGLISNTKPETKVKITVLREGKEKELSAEIGKRKGSPLDLYYRYLPKFPEFYFPPLPRKEIEKNLEDTLKKFKEPKIKKEAKGYI